MITNIQAVTSALEDSVRKFTDIAVIGISGGVDSSVVASIAVRALGKDQVHLVSMPFDDTDTRTFNARSAGLAKKLQAIHHIVPIGEPSIALLKVIKGIFSNQPLEILTEANIRPRVRMSVLYAISGELGFKTGKRVRVLGTGHLSEDLIGYDTKGGDALCDLFILSDLVKSEVYQLANYYGVPDEIIKAPPSAGLYPGQTDEGELGFSYDQLESATLKLFDLVRQGISDEQINPNLIEFSNLNKEVVNFVVTRFKAHSHKHRAPATASIRCKECFFPG